MLRIERNQVSPDIVVLQLAGRVCMGRDVQELEWKIDELLGDEQRRVVLDLANVTHIDSTGIGIVVLCAGKLKNSGGELRVAGAAGLVDNVLRMTKVDSLVAMFADAASAARDFRAASA